MKKLCVEVLSFAQYFLYVWELCHFIVKIVLSLIIFIDLLDVYLGTLVASRQ